MDKITVLSGPAKSIQYRDSERCTIPQLNAMPDVVVILKDDLDRANAALTLLSVDDTEPDYTQFPITGRGVRWACPDCEGTGEYERVACARCSGVGYTIYPPVN